MPWISFLLPTRGKPDLARGFLRSLYETAHRPEEIEVILGVDEDDPQSHSLSHEGLAIKTVILPRGLTMGALNRACFDASTGRYVMLINDDVIVRTPGWDTTIYRAFARFGDDIALVHVNDLLFQERLCTFPILSRKACLEIGICPACYRRYRIDDHICDTYGLLACLGHERRVYLKDVVFEHGNYTTAGAARGNAAPSFESGEGKVYVLEPGKFAGDSRDFAALLEDRKRDTCKLARLIETAAVESRQAAYETLLAKVRDPFGCRPAYGRTSPAPPQPGESAEIGKIARRRSFLTTARSVAESHPWTRILVTAAREGAFGVAAIPAPSPAGPPRVRPCSEDPEATRRAPPPAARADRIWH